MHAAAGIAKELNPRLGHETDYMTAVVLRRVSRRGAAHLPRLRDPSRAHVSGDLTGRADGGGGGEGVAGAVHRAAKGEIDRTWAVRDRERSSTPAELGCTAV